VRSKNAKNIVLKNLLDACFGAICFYLVGYGFAYGGTKDTSQGGKFIGWSGFALNGEARDSYYSWFFQFAVRIRASR
jgi:ammonium transporter, Amt family